MREQIREQIRQEFKKLESGEVTSISLDCVCPRDIDEVIGEIENMEFNGWQSDYWGAIDGKYNVSGCMYDGDAVISLKEEE